MNVITAERAKQEGLTKKSLLWVSQWHKEQAMKVKGEDRERHFKIAAMIKKVSDEI